MIWLSLILAAIAAAPFVIEHYRIEMNDGRRGSAPGQFAELSQGVTHYHMTGPSDGPLVVCVHGLTTPSFVWSQLTKRMIDDGLRVLVYDLYGRGYSDRPDGPNDKKRFNQQLDDLLVHLDIEEPFFMIGYSMGGAIASGFAATYPARVRKLVLLATASITLHQTPLLRVIRERGIFGTWLMLAAFPKQIRKGIRAENETGQAPPEIIEGQKAQLAYKGFVPAVLASIRGILATPMEGEHLTLHRAGLPILAIWGGEDTVIPESAMGQLAAWNRDVIHEVIDDAGHGLPYTHTDEAYAYIGSFLPAPQSDDWGHET